MQLSGALGQGNPDIDGPQLALRLADFFGGVCRLVPAPALVDSAELCQSLMRQSQVATALSRASHPDIVVQGIGCLDPALCSLQRAGYLGDAERQAAIDAGAVGHVFARMIDSQGREVGDYGRRVIAEQLEAIRRAPAFHWHQRVHREGASDPCGAARRLFQHPRDRRSVGTRGSATRGCDQRRHRPFGSTHGAIDMSSSVLSPPLATGPAWVSQTRAIADRVRRRVLEPDDQSQWLLPEPNAVEARTCWRRCTAAA